MNDYTNSIPPIYRRPFGKLKNGQCRTPVSGLAYRGCRKRQRAVSASQVPGILEVNQLRTVVNGGWGGGVGGEGRPLPNCKGKAQMGPPQNSAWGTVLGVRRRGSLPLYCPPYLILLEVPKYIGASHKISKCKLWKVQLTFRKLSHSGTT